MISNWKLLVQFKYCLIFNICIFRTAAIHAEAPEFTDMSVEQEILVTGIKVVDLLAPYAKGGKIGTWDNQHPHCYTFLQLANSSLMTKLLPFL